jgi:pyrroline-5-carboxylate reductase
VDLAKAQALAQEAEATQAVSLEAGLTTADVILLAIKPQNLPAFLASVQGRFSKEQLLISILAGTPIQKLRQGVGPDIDIIRAMPNTPALVDEGIAAICGGSAESREIARALFDCVGEVLEVDESMMDAVTAVSGSGPAYVFYFLESFVSAAKAQGFSDEEARALVYQTVHGSLTLMEETGETPEELRRRVTSPGGTTQAALEALQALGFPGAVEQGVAAAVKRSKELGK